MELKQTAADIALGLIGGYVGTKAMAPVSMKLYDLESEQARAQEDKVRPGPPYEIAARKTTELLGLHLSDKQVEMVGTLGFHYGIGMSWGVVYQVLRRTTRLPAPAAGLLMGAAMSLIVDEGMTPLLGFSAPNRDYPLVTHLRGVVAHLVYGLGTAAAAEAIGAIGRNGSHRYRCSDKE